MAVGLLSACSTYAPPPAGRALAPARAQFASAPALRPQADDLRVMSFNVRVPFHLDGFNYWAHRKDLLVATIRQSAPDVLGVQECVASQARYLLGHLPKYGFMGAGRDDGRLDGEMTAIFYRRDKYVLLDGGHFWLSETPGRVGSKGWDAGWRRMCSWAILEPIGGGRRFAVFNTHFDVAGDKARFRSAELLRTQIARIAGGLPTVVTGDFNCPEGSAPYRVLTAGAGLVDTYREAHPTRTRREGTRHGFNGSAGDKRIDWILTTDGFDTVAAGINRTRAGGRYPSDHFPVEAILRWDALEARARLAAHVPRDQPPATPADSRTGPRHGPSYLQ